MYPSAVGPKFLVQYAVTGGGAFNGTEFGRARLTANPVGPIDGRIYFAAKNYGSAPNLLTMQYIDAGAGAVVSTTSVVQLGSAIQVSLRRNALGILATAPEVAAAINAFTAYTSPAYAIRARPHNPSATQVLAALSPVNFTGGVNPLQIGTQYLWTPPAATNAGYVDFEQENPMWILGFSAKFTILGPGPLTVTVRRVRVQEDFTPILSEAVPIFVYNGLTPAAPDIAYTDVKQLIHPGQGLLVETSTPLDGMFNFDVMRAGEFPYA
jgi:hypothetical protein